MQPHDNLSRPPAHKLSTIYVELTKPFPDSDFERPGVLHPFAIADRLDRVCGPGCWFLHTYVTDAATGLVCVSLTLFGIQMTALALVTGNQWHAGYADAFRQAAALFGVGRAQMAGTPTPAHAETTRPYTDRPVQPPPTNSNARVMARPEPEGQQRAVLPATSAQVSAIYAIAHGAHHMEDDDIEAHAMRLHGAKPSGLSRQQASLFIDWLKAGAQ